MKLVMMDVIPPNNNKPSGGRAGGRVAILPNGALAVFELRDGALIKCQWGSVQVTNQFDNLVENINAEIERGWS